MRFFKSQPEKKIKIHQDMGIGPDKEIYLHKILIIFLPINLNMCFVCSKEPSH